MPAKPRVFLQFFSVVTVFALALAIAWPALGNTMGLAALASLVIGSAIAFWRVLEERENPSHIRSPSSVFALPKKWQRWLLGEDK